MAKNLSYHEEKNFENIIKCRELRKSLPSFTTEYFVGIESRTTSQTRLNYARDLVDFFRYLSLEVFNIPIVQISLQNLDNLAVTDIENYIDFLSYFKRNGKIYTNSLSSKSRKLSSIRSFFKYYFNKDKLSSNVASKVPLPKLHEKPIIRLDSDEVNKLLVNSEELNVSNMTKRQKNYNKNIIIRDVAILTLFLGTGIRVSECVGIDLDDIDFTKNAFKVTRKGGDSVILYFSDEVAMALANYLEIREKSFNLINLKEKAFFLSLQGKRLTVRSIQNIVKKYSEGIIPLKNITPHKLRSTYGTNLYNASRDIFVVAEVLGHSDVNTTRRYYTTISENIKKEASKMLTLKDDEE